MRDLAGVHWYWLQVSLLHQRGGMTSPPDSIAILQLLVKLSNAKTVIEVGVFTGMRFYCSPPSMFCGFYWFTGHLFTVRKSWRYRPLASSLRLWLSGTLHLSWYIFICNSYFPSFCWSSFCTAAGLVPHTWWLHICCWLWPLRRIL